nr:MAG TPA: hypothetical protein [Caudoviricetes sp.]DAU46760.1 MAG TPA: hypothetical protein [Caudoviricetes sp.]
MSIGSSFTAPAAHMASKAVLGSSLVTGICLNLRGLVDGRVGEHSINHLTGNRKRRSHERK